jgi:FYVE/RhoGEF/PH domain-containing protein 5/6
MRRESVSVASFDSLPEEGEAPVVRNGFHGHMAPGRLKGRVESQHRRRRRDFPRPVDDPLEAKRRKVIEEFYETERAYVDGLELVYSVGCFCCFASYVLMILWQHFLTPIVISLDTPNPLLDRSALTTVFSNFIDIWNLHRSFFSSLSSHLLNSGITTSASPSDRPLPSLSPILLSHFPYLSLYTPFITSFATSISALNSLTSPPNAFTPNLALNSSRNARTDDSLQYNPAFATFIAEQERDPRCGKLKLRDWLLTIVQRTPRYLLLLKDLIAHTNPEDPEHAQLSTAHALVSKSISSTSPFHLQSLTDLLNSNAFPQYVPPHACTNPCAPSPSARHTQPSFPACHPRTRSPPSWPTRTDRTRRTTSSTRILALFRLFSVVGECECGC